MKRQQYFNFITRQLSALITNIKLRARQNILDLNIHSEDFYVYFCNLLFDWKLRNANSIDQNVESIDLIDSINKVIVQVSSTASKYKIQKTLLSLDGKYKDYEFYFIALVEDCGKLRSESYDVNENSVNFEPTTNVLDVHQLLSKIKHLSIDSMTPIYNLVKAELSNIDSADINKIDTNLATIVKILSEIDPISSNNEQHDVNPYKIEEKITFNQITYASILIDDNKIYYNKLDDIYTKFDEGGHNKSASIFAKLKYIYVENFLMKNKDELFFKLIHHTKDYVRNSANYEDMPDEELERCISIIIVDSFIRCKIFEKPPGEYNVTT